MAERVFRSAGVSTREIDLSAPAQNTPTGVPAGIIGTSDEGPAFVPITVSNTTAFQTTFGSIDGTKFGPIAVAEYLRNAQSATYMRVLGIGDGKKRNTTSGIVTNAGFVVGNRQVQKTVNGALSDNPFANTGEGSVLGRTYFLGCFMSESAGSTVFSSAGIQKDHTFATAADAIDLTGFTDAGSDTTFTFTIPTSAGGTGVTTSILLDDSEATDGAEGANKIAIACDGSDANSDAKVAALVIKAINGTTDSLIDAANAGAGQGAEGIKGITAAQGSSDTQITLTMDAFGARGNVTNALGSDTLVDLRTFSGGSGGAIPILRGVLLAPSGVILHLSGNSRHNTNTPVTTQTAAAAGGIFGKHGAITGSLLPSTEVFTMLLNGHKNTATFPNVITASFSLTNEQQYFRNVFNTDPKKIEQAGHLLYTSYDVHPNLAVVTGSGVVAPGKYSKGEVTKEDTAFLLTSSLARNVGSSTVPNFEDFQDRFGHAETPFIISQKYGGSNKNLFKVVALSAGSKSNTKIKVSIDNITRINATSYPTFDLSVRDFFDTDEEKITLESFRSLSLDPNSPRFIGRVIGDLNVFFDFDKETLSQKINVNGDHPILSSYIRIVMTDSLKNGNIPVDAMPMGFRGPLTLNTSGSIMCQETDAATFAESDILRRVQQPPIPYRRTIALSTGTKKRVNTDLNWGVQFNRQTSVTEPNKQTLFDETLISLVKYVPDHRIDVAKFNRASDTFQNNLFSLENIRVRTGSNGKADPDLWLSASYVRNGLITADHNTPAASATGKTRALLPKDFETPANRKFSGFNVFLQNGFDGLNIFDEEKSKLTNVAARREMLEAGQGLTSGPTIAAYRKAVDVMGSKSDVDIKLLAIPGLREPAITDFAITAVESRFDAMYIMDIEEYDKFNTVITGSNQIVHVGNTVNAFKGRGLDSSFAAAYFPDVVKSMRVTTSGRKPTNREVLVNVPPSVVALGAFALNDAIAHPWFAPAGFTRGALNAVKAANVRLNRDNLDELYDVDINPITAFPGTGLVIWGQKTLLQNSSALDRVNVRRLLIDVRRAVRNVANTLLFEPNRQETLERFNALVNPILQRVQEQGGVDRFKVIIDTTTTTQADVENNTIRGKIFLQPTRAVEFVALDFVVTNAGADAI